MGSIKKSIVDVYVNGFYATLLLFGDTVNILLLIYPVFISVDALKLKVYPSKFTF